MEEQGKNKGAAAPANPRKYRLKMVIINIVVSALVSSIVFFALAGSLSVRILILEQRMDKLTNKVIVK